MAGPSPAGVERRILLTFDCVFDRSRSISPAMLRPIRHLLTAVLFLVGAMPAVHAGLWEEANTAFAAGEYGKARDLYEQVIEQDGPNADRLFNLGNTFAKLDQPGPAVLCYERAALLAPRDADIQANLKLTRPATASSLVAPPPWWKSPLYWLSLNEWSWLTALGIAALTAPILTRTLLSPRPGWLQRAVAPLMLFGLALALPGALAFQQRHAERNLAILTTDKPVLRLSPFPTANPVDAGPLLPGQRIIPGGRHGDWVYLSIPGSSASGWVPDKDIALIIPAS